MLGRTHLLTAFTIGIISLKLFHISSPIIFFLALILGSLFPDIDSKTSILGRRLKFFNFFLKHRGFFHSISLLILLLLIIYPISMYFAIGFALGFISHLLLDAITKEGIYFLFLGRVKGKIKVGSWQEQIFSFFLIIIIIYFFVTSFV